MKRFSICIPNYNYAHFIGETIESVLNQTYQEFEICIADNASTDNSWEIIQGYAIKDDRIKAIRNPYNVGFAGNLDRVASMATGEWIIMLSSDDKMFPNALDIYSKIISLSQSTNIGSFVITSTFEKIDSEGRFIEYLNLKQSTVWKEFNTEPSLSEAVKGECTLADNRILLKNCLLKFYNPYNFASTAFSRESYTRVGGYEGSRMMNPDKWFHWKLMALTEYSCYIDIPLFQYRWHQSNQTSQLATSGALKFWIDEYRNSFEVSDLMLEKADLQKHVLSKFFVEYGMKYVILNLKVNNRQEAQRIYNFVKAAYPKTYLNNKYTLMSFFSLVTYPISSYFIKLLHNQN